MENIRTKIQLAVEGGRQVGQLSDQITKLGKDIKLVNTGAQGIVNSFRVVNKVLSEAKKNFRDVSLDTAEAAKSAEQLVAANNQVNATLRQRNQLLQDAGNKLARESRATTPEIQRALSPTTGGSRQQQMVNQQVNEQLNRQAQGVLDMERMRITVRNNIINSLKEEAAIENQILNDKAARIQQDRDETQRRRSRQSIERRRDQLDLPGARFARFRRNRTRGDRQIRNQAISNATIGGAFPLLFGQGPGAAIGGAAGGFGGGIMGGQFGFALSLAGTALGSAIDNVVKTLVGGASELGQALGPFTQDTEAITASLGLQNSVQQAQIKLIEQVEGKTAAFNAAMKLMANDIGQRGVDALKQFGESSRILSSQFTLALTKLQAFAAGVANFVLRITGLENRLKKADAGRVVGAAAVRGNSQALGLIQRQKQIDEMGSRGGEGKRKEALQAQLDIEKQIFAIREQQKTKLGEITLEYDQAVQKNKEELELKEAVKKLTETGMSQAIAKEVAQREQLRDKVLEEVDALADALRLERAKLGNTDTELQRLKEIDAVLADILKKRQEINGETDKAVGKIKSTGDEIKKVKVTKEEIADLLANEMTNALMGLIEGTKSLGESLASIAKSLAKMFLNAAFQNIFNNMFQISEQGSYNRAGGFKAFQYGGVVNSPTLGMIGEGGEPEYVIPASKMDGAMSRYSAGARGGAVIPGGSHESGTVAGGSGNAIVEYTGPVLNFNGDEYVPKSAVPEIIGAATKQGAMAGKAQVIGTLRNSRSQRASLGL
mgnify:CR=1 FL=1